MKKINLIILFFVVCTFLVSCSVSNKDEDTKTLQDNNGIYNYITDKEPVKGGIIKLFTTPIDTLNPIYTKNPNVKDFLDFVYESLVTIDRNQKTMPRLAKSWETSEDGLVLTFKLRNDVYWHDGIRFSSDDVEFTFSAIMDNRLSSIYRKNLENVVGYSIVDDYTFKIILSKPYAFTVENFTFPIIPKHYFLGEDMSTTVRNMVPIGTGPYKFIKYEEQKEIDLKENDKWWNLYELKERKIKIPYIEEVKIKIYPSTQNNSNAFLAKEVDVITAKSGNFSIYTGRNDLILQQYTGRNFEYIAMNLRGGFTSDKYVRQAIAMSINKEEIIGELIPGEVIESDLPVIPGNPINDTDSGLYNYNMGKGRKILIDNGWTQEDGKMYKIINGLKTYLSLEILINDDNENRYKVSKKIASQLNDIGIKVNITKLTWEELQTRIKYKNFDIALMGCSVPVAPDISFMYSSKESYLGFNTSGYSNPTVDKYLEQISTYNDINKRKILFSSVKEILKDEVPYIGMYFYNDAVIYNKRVNGEMNPNIWNKYNDFTKWYVVDK